MPTVIASVKKVGFPVLAVTTSYSADKLKAADWVVSSLELAAVLAAVPRLAASFKETCMRLCSMIAGVFLGALLSAGPIWAQPQPTAIGDAGDDYPVMVNAPWAGAVVIGIAGFFLAGLVIGPAVRIHAPPTHAHDEPPGTSGHHGRMGIEGEGH